MTTSLDLSSRRDLGYLVRPLALVDLVPFGHLERPNRTIAWPPDANPVMSVFGFAEACATAIPVRLNGDLTVPVASAPCQAVLKLIAWSERGYDQPRRDATDMRILLRAYGDPMNTERLFTTDLQILERYDYDAILAGAALLGTDAGRSIGETGVARLVAILEPDNRAVERLAHEMGGERRLNAEMLAAFRAGLLTAH